MAVSESIKSTSMRHTVKCVALFPDPIGVLLLPMIFYKVSVQLFTLVSLKSESYFSILLHVMDYVDEVPRCL